MLADHCYTYSMYTYMYMYMYNHVSTFGTCRILYGIKEFFLQRIESLPIATLSTFLYCPL